VVALAVDAGALNAYTIRQGSAFGADLGTFDLAEHLESHSFAGQAPELRLREFLAAAHGDEGERRLLAGTPVRLTGFVVGDGSTDGFLLARLMIGCCAGDAVGLVVAVTGYDGPPLPDDTWAQVTGTFVDEDGGPTDEAEPTLALTGLRQVDEPDEPYEYPS
jgi:uncharacterized repeat protein (TIGR03943 family)